MAANDPGLREKDPKLAAVVDKQSQRNLLADPNPLVVDTTAGRSVKVALGIENGPEGLIHLKVGSPKEWVQPITKTLTIVGGGKEDCLVAVRPDGNEQFGSLLFSWEGAKKPLQESVMIMRKLPAGRDTKPPVNLGDLLASPWTLYPLATGITLLMADWAFVGTAGVLTFLGVLAVLGAVGSLITRWML